MDEGFLDHMYIEDEGGAFYVVYGNTHPPGRVYAYLKYLLTVKRTPWCRGNVCYERIVQHYGLHEILGASQSLEYEPAYGVYMPVLRLRGREKIHDPRRRLFSLVSRPRDRLEEDIACFIDGLKGVVPLNSLGVTGSVLAGIHNPRISDADITVHGCVASLRLVEHLRETGMLSSISSSELAGWADRVAGMHGGSIEWALSLYRPWRRGVWRRRVFSIIPVSEVQGRYGELVYRGLRCVEALIEVERGDCKALFTPALVGVEKVFWMRGAAGPPPTRLLSFENLFSPLLYEGGILHIRGELARSGKESVLLVGTRRCGGVVKRPSP